MKKPRSISSPRQPVTDSATEACILTIQGESEALRRHGNNQTFLRKFASAVLAILWLTGQAHAGLVITSDDLYRGYANNYQNVGYVENSDGNGGYEFNASGVLIDSHWVLMSAHQALAIDSDPNSVYGSFRFGLGSNFYSDRGETMAASELFINPSYGGSVNAGYDQALLYFENPFASVAPVTFYTGDVAVGMDSDIVGYGRLQLVNDPNVSLTGDRRAGNNVIFGISSATGAPYASTVLRDASRSTYRELGMGGRNGDSGGGLFINGELAGITTSASSSNIFGSDTRYSLLDYDWISTTMASRPPTAVPEPSSFILLGIGSGLAALKRRRRKIISNRELSSPVFTLRIGK